MFSKLTARKYDEFSPHSGERRSVDTSRRDSEHGRWIDARSQSPADLYDDKNSDLASPLDALDGSRGDLPYAESAIGGWQRAIQKQLSITAELNCLSNGGPDWDRTSDLPRVRRTLSP